MAGLYRVGAGAGTGQSLAKTFRCVGREVGFFSGWMFMVLTVGTIGKLVADGYMHAGRKP